MTSGPTPRQAVSSLDSEGCGTCLTVVHFREGYALTTGADCGQSQLNTAERLPY